MHIDAPGPMVTTHLVEVRQQDQIIDAHETVLSREKTSRVTRSATAFFYRSPFTILLRCKVWLDWLAASHFAEFHGVSEDMTRVLSRRRSWMD